jgi:Ca-activated chloride channel family protein
MKEWLNALHFLRPDWFWFLAAVPVLLLSLRFSEDVRARWRRYINPELLEHLIVSPTRSWRLRPIHTLCALIVLGSVALAGPTWSREQPPFTEDKAHLVIALDLSQTMDAIDLDPTRLERAKLKIHDLIEERTGARTALFVYAGSAHMVLPFTADKSLFELYLNSLSTNLMPRSGKNTARAVETIEDFLKDETDPGTILFITDGIEPQALPAFRQFLSRYAGRDDILVMGVGTAAGGPVHTYGNRFLTDSAGRRVYAKLDVNALRNLKQLGIDATSLTLNDDDIQWIQRRVQHHLQAVRQLDSKTRPIDKGYWLTIPIAVIAAFSFRRGWTVRWTSAALAFVFILPPPATEHRFRWMDLWLTNDQQGRYYFERGEFEQAAKHFENPIWRGVALERAGHFDDALNAFALSDSAEGWYNQGNALTRLGKYPEAVEAYRQALERRHSWAEAQENMALVKSLIPKASTKKDDQEEQEQAPNLPPDQIKFDNKGKQGRKIAMKANLDPKTIADIWMRNIQTTPAGFLRQRFAIQAAQEKR